MLRNWRIGDKKKRKLHPKEKKGMMSLYPCSPCWMNC